MFANLPPILLYSPIFENKLQTKFSKAKMRFNYMIYT
nr:MAG TPA: hypothetical protein [Caudoviricetes sp.]